MITKELFSGKEMAETQKCLWYLGFTKKEPEVGFMAAIVWVLITSFSVGCALEMSYQCL